jgi:hypothetical protein
MVVINRAAMYFSLFDEEVSDNLWSSISHVSEHYLVVSINSESHRVDEDLLPLIFGEYLRWLILLI